MSDEPVRRKGRSPNYPGIDLKLALERAKTLWDQEQHHPAANEVILRHWGYGPRSGGGSVAFAALKRFGLLEDAGNGQARLTQLAQTILLSQREGRLAAQQIRDAALLPPIHKELWDLYGKTLPSPESLQYELVTKRGFTPGGAAEFVSEYKRTLTYAGLLAKGDDTIPANDQEKPKTDSEIMTPPATITEEQPPAPPAADEGRTTRTVQVTYSPTEWALLQASFPMSEGDWEAMMDVLKAMKRGLVERSGSES